MHVYIVPTYECNLDCNRCYSKKFLEEFDQYLSWECFIHIFTLFRKECNSFSFIGGEPAKWKFINEAILFLKNKKKKVTVFTNCTIPIQARPTNMVVNGTNIFIKDLSNTIIKQLQQYKYQGIKICLRFNIDDQFTDAMINNAVAISRNFANSVSVSILFPAKFTRTIGNSVYSLCNELISNGVKVRISRATPLCIFSEEQRKFLEIQCGLSGQCPLPTNSIVIHPDGKSIQPCVELELRKNINDLIKAASKDIFGEEIDKIKKKENLKCAGCELFKTNKCCGGCISYK